MRVDPRRLGLAAAVLVGAVFAVAAVSCGGGQPQQQATAEAASAAPKVLTAAERAAWYQDCWTQFNNKDWAKLKACYADTAQSDQVDSGLPVAKGADAVLASSKAITESFPDMKGAAELIVIKGDTIVAVGLITATHTGPLTGPGYQSIPATNKPIGYLQAHLVQTDSTGAKVVKEEFYSDTLTLMAQLGLSQSPARPVITKAATAPKVVVAAGTPSELSNVDLVRAQMAAYNSHDAKGVAAYNASDFVYRDMTAPADLTAAESLAGTVEFFKAFPDAKLVPLSIWGAGDYVVVTGRFEGTNKAAAPAMGLKKATNKAVSVRYLNFSRWDNGKLKEEWLFGDGAAMARQLGLLKE